MKKKQTKSKTVLYSDDFSRAGIHHHDFYFRCAETVFYDDITFSEKKNEIGLGRTTSPLMLSSSITI